MTFLRNLFGLARAHPLAALLTLAAVVVLLGGLVWKGIDLVLGLIRKVPGGGAVADAVDKAAKATGSA